MKRVLLTVTLFLAPIAAHAENGAKIEQSVQVASSYSFEEQAAVVSQRPVANYTVTVSKGDVGAYAWGQVGDEFGREIDLGLTFDHTFDAGASLRGELATYLYPDGFEPVYTAGVGASVPFPHGFSLDGSAQRYVGGFDSTKLALSLSHDVGSFSLTVGHAWNRPEHLDPWFARISIPLGSGEHAPVLGLRGFAGAGSGGVVDLTWNF